MTNEYNSNAKISGWYYDLQTDWDPENVNGGRLTCASLHPNMEIKDNKWVPVSDSEIDPDDDTLENDIVTLRDRDTMKQIKIKVSDLKSYIEDKIRL
jgi:hypothetical protein